MFIWRFPPHPPTLVEVIWKVLLFSKEVLFFTNLRPLAKLKLNIITSTWPPPLCRNVSPDGWGQLGIFGCSRQKKITFRSYRRGDLKGGQQTQDWSQWWKPGYFFACVTCDAHIKEWAFSHMSQLPCWLSWHPPIQMPQSGVSTLLAILSHHKLLPFHTYAGCHSTILK